jgi:hypothetical protein
MEFASTCGSQAGDQGSDKNKLIKEGHLDRDIASTAFVELQEGSG